MKLDSDKLTAIIETINDDIYATDLTTEKLQERVATYTDDDGKMGIGDFAQWMMQESRDYTTIYTRRLIEALAAAGYLNDPGK